MSKANSLIQSVKAMYNPRENGGKGRMVVLLDSIITGIYNVFITGIFYTSFLSMYDISITGVGIVSFIPYIANCFCIFSPNVLSKCKNRKAAMLGAKIIFYALYIVATTVMPLFVLTSHGRLVWLIAILFVAHAFYALFSPGVTSWYASYIPERMQDRSQYFTFNQFITSALANIILLLSSVIADAVSASPFQKQLILGFRYFAFALVLLDVFFQTKASSNDIECQKKVNLKEFFVLPFQHVKFLMCMLLMFFWSFNSNLNNGVWQFHLLNHMHLSYTTINIVSALYVVIFAFTSNAWRKALNRFSWIYTFGIANLFWVVTEVIFFFMTPDRGWIFVPNALIQQFLSVGLNLSYANVLYMNLPSEKSTTYVSFQTVGCNLFAFLGMMLGTWISSINGEQTIHLLGMDVYPMLFTCLLRAINMLAIGIVCVKCWKMFSSDGEIQRVEDSKPVSPRAMR